MCTVSIALIVRELSSSAHVIVSCCPEEGSIMRCSENVLRVMDRMERTHTFLAETHINTQVLFRLSWQSLVLPELGRARCWWHSDVWHTPGFSSVPEHFSTERLLTARLWACIWLQHPLRRYRILHLDEKMEQHSKILVCVHRLDTLRKKDTAYLSQA